MQPIKPELHQWTPALRARFLDHLSAEADVRAAAAACGLSRQSAYKLRRRDTMFARAWDAALARSSRRAPIERDLSPASGPWIAWLGDDGQRGDRAREFLRLLAEIAGVTGARFTPGPGNSLAWTPSTVSTVSTAKTGLAGAKHLAPGLRAKGSKAA